MARKRRPRKRELDLREFWPWYERSINRGLDAEPPPFRLSDIHDDAKDPPPPPAIRRVLQILQILVAVVLIGAMVYAIFR